MVEKISESRDGVYCKAHGNVACQICNDSSEQQSNSETKPDKNVDEVIAQKIEKLKRLSDDPSLLGHTVQELRNDYENLYAAANLLEQGEKINEQDRALIDYYPGFTSKDFAQILEQLPTRDNLDDFCRDFVRENPDELGHSLTKFGRELEHIASLNLSEESKLAIEARDDLAEALQTPDPSALNQLLERLAADDNLWGIRPRANALRSLIDLLPELPADTWSRIKKVGADN